MEPKKYSIKQRYERNRIKKLVKKRKRWLDYIYRRNSDLPFPDNKKFPLPIQIIDKQLPLWRRILEAIKKLFKRKNVD